MKKNSEHRPKKKQTEKFLSGLERLGFKSDLDKNLYLVAESNKYKEKPCLWFCLEKGRLLEATAIYFRKTFEGRGDFIPQVYIYDFTHTIFNDSVKAHLTEIHRKIWSSSEVPLTCIFFPTEIKILDCTVPINAKNDEPVYLIKKISLTGNAHKLYNRQFANKIKSGVFWDQEENQKKFSFSESSYDKLINYLREKVIKDFVTSENITKKDLIHKLIIQSILIKYLEERQSNEHGKITKVFEDKFFMKFDGATCFCDVLRNGNFFKLCNELNRKDKFNGNIFEWSDREKDEIKNYDLNKLANALDGNSDEHGQHYFWRQYDFNYVPIELISRLYEEFIINYNEKTNKAENGKVYTPAHLAKFLVDESLPLDKSQSNNHEYKILDPACGSGIFLVIAFKRLIQWWRLKNDMKKPSSNELKTILKNSIFGVDKDKKATQLTAFSLTLAICDELSPKEIWDDLQFDDLTESNIFNRDFFEWKKEKFQEKYDLIIGNPPFVRGGIEAKEGVSKLNHKKIKIPQNQIALKFLTESIDLLKTKGLICLIIKASGLLYSSTSKDFRKTLFSNFNIKQILDFTPLARNNCLWDGSDVAAAAIFLKNEQPDIHTNILHAVFRRTKASKKRIVFEIDDYDLHFINRQTAVENPFIWKINLLGGGRIKNLVEKLRGCKSLEKYSKNNKGIIIEEGVIIGSKGKLSPLFMSNMPHLPTKAFNEKGIDLSKLEYKTKILKYEKIPDELAFTPPNIIIKENIGEKFIPVYFNKSQAFSFKRQIIGIHAEEKSLLNEILIFFRTNNELYRAYIFCTSGKLLINKNTAFVKEDIMRLPIEISEKLLSDIDKNIISDINNFMQKFLRNGENSNAVKPIPRKDNGFINKFGEEFSKALNLIYDDGNKKFRLSDIIRFNDNEFIGTIFVYDDKKQEPKISNLDYDSKDIKELLQFNFSEHLSTKRIITYYKKNKVVFIKPNQKRYWLSLYAYHDADKTFADIET